LLKKPGFKFIAVLVLVLALALEIGTNSAIFSIVQKPLSKSATTPRLENKILGEGAPTVVFSPGFSGQMKTWFGIQPVVVKYTRTFVYHRAGFGRSEMGPEPRTADRLATELRESLKEAKADPPFLLVGLSVGGLYDRVFAHKYPDDIAGIILVVEYKVSALKTVRIGPRPTGGMTMPRNNIFAMKFARVYPLYVQKAEGKNRTKEEVDKIICWLTGYNRAGLQQQIEQENDFETFFAQAPAIHPNSSLIKGVVCGIRVEEIEDPLMQKIRYLDKLIDELAKGKAMEKILRK